ncbi:MAG: hypothetical protein IPJ60_01465 [Sphingobacteriaceae bacterium]|nr:hypothetical protein [Sphingobacteriaceae bacterium]
MHDFLSKKAGLKGVRASSKKEAILFIIAAAMQFPEDSKKSFFSKSLIINDETDMTNFSYRKYSHNLILDLNTDLHFAVTGRGHHVLQALGPDDEYESGLIMKLPTLDEQGLVTVLGNVMKDASRAIKVIKDCGSNLSIIKKKLIWGYKTNWEETADINELVPALIVGRWNEENSGDIEIIEKLAGEKYVTYKEKLIKWRDSDIPVLLNIANTWRLTSPMEAWTNLSSQLKESDFHNLRTAFLEVLSDKNPALEVAADVRFMASVLGKKSIYSSGMKEGLSQSLIMVGLFGSNLEVFLNKPQAWVDEVVSILLSKANDDIWPSINYQLPLISEASPESFLKVVESTLTLENTPILKMFEQEASIVFQTSRHTGLLWALESLAWFPEYLERAALLLAKLAALDPGGSLTNRPINSLVEIFKIWHQQTYANLEQRIDVLKRIAEKEPKISWQITSKLLPRGGHDVAHGTSKMRWRAPKEQVINYSRPEIVGVVNALVDIAISLFDNSEHKLAEFIKFSQYLDSGNRDKILKFVGNKYDSVPRSENEAWDALRDVIYAQKSYPESESAMVQGELAKYEKLYIEKQPKDDISNLTWLFDDHWPRLPDGFIRPNKSIEEQTELIKEKRIEALSKIYKQYGIEKIKELSFTVKYPFSLASTLNEIQISSTELLSIVSLISNDEKNLSFIYYFLDAKTRKDGIQWIIELYSSLVTLYPTTIISRLFIPLQQNQTLWDAINKLGYEIEVEYWKRMNPILFAVNAQEKIYGINKLIEVQRPIAVIQAIVYNLDDVPTETLVRLLKSVPMEDNHENNKLKANDVAAIFVELDKRNEVSNDDMKSLEMLYLSALTYYGGPRENLRPFIMK